MRQLTEKSQTDQKTKITAILPCVLSMMFLISGVVEADPLTSVQIGLSEMKDRHTYSKYNVIGTCLWEKWEGVRPHFYLTLEVTQYKPDLVVSVYNQYGDNPWTLADTVIDTPSKTLSAPLYSAALGIRGFSGEPLGEGNNATEMGHLSYANLRTKLVDVIGSPLNTVALALPQLDSDTTPLFPYYQSEMDTLGRAGVAEAIRPETYSILTHPIGESAALNHWSFEFPRNMNVNIDNDFKADAVLALRAADIVTNKNTLHTVKSTEDSCGKNCAVATVIEENNEDHEEWQEVYPTDRHVIIGQSDVDLLVATGSEDAIKDSNMVFVIWRHYQGCVQHSGNLISSTEKINQAVKR